MPRSGPTGFETMSLGLKNAANYHRWLFDLTRPYLGRNVLECGTGNGIMTRFLTGAGPERIYSVDADSNCINKLKSDVSSDKLTLEVFDINSEYFVEVFKRRNIDTVILFNVLEHLPQDTPVLSNIREILAPEGKVLLFVPAFNSLFGGMDSAAGHYRRYSIRDINDKMAISGLTKIRADYLNPLGFFGWWITNKVLKVKNLNDPLVNGQIELFDNIGLPVSNALTFLTKRNFGQSIFAVGKRGASGG